MRSAVCSRLGDPRFLWSFRFQGFGPVVSELLGIFVLKLARVRRLRYLVALSNFEASCMQGLRLGAGCLVRIPLHRPGSAKVAEAKQFGSNHPAERLQLLQSNVGSA